MKTKTLPGPNITIQDIYLWWFLSDEWDNFPTQLWDQLENI